MIILGWMCLPVMDVSSRDGRSGKLLNVRDATHTQIMNNTEISSINKILGLQHGKVYDTVKSLRYGHLMIMTDQVRVQE